MARYLFKRKIRSVRIKFGEIKMKNEAV